MKLATFCVVFGLYLAYLHAKGYQILFLLYLGYMDLSRKRVEAADAEKCTERFSRAKAVNSILRHAAYLLGYEKHSQLEELHEKTAWRFDKKYQKKGSAYFAFKQAVQ